MFTPSSPSETLISFELRFFPTRARRRRRLNKGIRCPPPECVVCPCPCQVEELVVRRVLLRQDEVVECELDERLTPEPRCSGAQCAQKKQRGCQVDKSKPLFIRFEILEKPGGGGRFLSSPRGPGACAVNPLTHHDSDVALRKYCGGMGSKIGIVNARCCAPSFV